MSLKPTVELEGKTYLTTGEAARRLFTTPATIRRYCDRGHLEVCRHPVNNYRFISEESVDRVLREFSKPIIEQDLGSGGK
ncbi:MAG: helix-turn-helix domain-containing protein [Candidatus Aenigmarchaeota archaeon]|nr:helix-turn-helix domain-containing protein [Candidatus Aenigmarchaeota archaeon]